MRRCIKPLPALLLAALLAACTSTTQRTGPKTNIAAFDAQVLRALKDKDPAAFVATLPPAATDPPRKLIDAEYELPANEGDTTRYILLIHRATRQVWIREGVGKNSQVFGPATYTAGQ